MSDRSPSVPSTGNLGFLAILQDAGGTIGGYLVTNAWGRPIEFRLSSAVQPNRVQHALYGPTLDEYLHADLIGKTLIEKTNSKPDLVVVSTLPALALRNRLEIPIVGLHLSERDPVPAEIFSFTHPRSSLRLLLPPRFRQDEAMVRDRLDRIDEAMDLAEPFARIQSAVVEHRKLGVTSRAA